MDKVELTGLEGLNTGELIFVVAKGDRVEVKLALTQLDGPPIMILFDVHVASPNISRRRLMRAAEWAALPQEVLAAIKALCQNEGLWLPSDRLL